MPEQPSFNPDQLKPKRTVSAERFEALKKIAELREKLLEAEPDSSEEKKMNKELTKLEKELGNFVQLEDDLDALKSGELEAEAVPQDAAAADLQKNDGIPSETVLEERPARKTISIPEYHTLQEYRLFLSRSNSYSSDWEDPFWEKYYDLSEKERKALLEENAAKAAETALKLGGSDRAHELMQGILEGKLEVEGVNEEKLIEGDVVGRAEYESVANQVLFEDKGALEMFPWLFKPGYGKGMIVAERGSGKTFFVRKLMKQIPTELWLLDKNTLKYSPQSVENPQVIVIDDLHYLLEAKRLDEIDEPSAGRRITNEEILLMFETVIGRAKNLNIKIVFVSNGTAKDLYDRFDKREDQIRFLSILSGCGISDRDIDTIEEGSVKMESVLDAEKLGQNILRFREVMDIDTLKRIKAYLKMNDLPFFQMTGWDEIMKETLRFVNANAEFRARFNRDIDDPEKLILRPDTNFFDNNPMGNEFRENRLRRDRSDPQHYDFKHGEIRPLGSIRELMVVAKQLGGINRATLGIKNGIPSEQFYSAKPIYELKKLGRVMTEDLVPYVELYEDLVKRAGNTTRFEEYCAKKMNVAEDDIPGRSKVFRKAYLVKRSYIKGLKVGDELYDREEKNVVGWKATSRRGKGGVVYTMADITEIGLAIKRKAFSIAGQKGLTPHARKLLSLTEGDRKEEEKAFLEHNLSKELPI